MSIDQFSIIHYGWLEVMSESSNSAWGKLSGKKPWKRRFIVLRHVAENSDEIQLASYDKDDQWKVAPPRKLMMLFPRYKISKLCNYRGKENCLEVDNEREQWHLSCDKLKNLDLWASQIQMQTKLSRSISGRIFSVSGAVEKDMQRIGAAQQRCLLHFTKWGVTLALQDSRSILAMWPLKTIRNYEDSNRCQFIIEAGRRAPMGEGVYKFNTNVGQDRDMFNVIDAFVNALLNEQAYTAGGKKQTTDEDILKTYDQLHKAATGFNADHRPRVHDSLETPGYSHIGDMKKISRDSTSLSIHKPPDYHHLYGADVDYTRVQLDEKKSSPNDSIDAIESPRGYSFSDNSSNYDKLGDRSLNWGADSPPGEYDHINRQENRKAQDNAYDKIARSEHNGSFKARSQGASWGMVGYPLRNEPSVPYLDEASGSYNRSKLSTSTASNGEKFVFRNSIYSPLGSSVGNSSQSPARRLTGTSQDFNSDVDPVRHGSTASDSGMRRRQTGTSIRDKSHQDIADHFLYQVPTVSPDGFKFNRDQTPIRGGLVDATLTGDIYQNADSLVDETSFMANELEKLDTEDTEDDHSKTDDEDTEIYENSLHVQSSFENRQMYRNKAPSDDTCAASETKHDE